MHRYTADEATVWTWRDYDRIAIKWRSQAHWDDIRVSLKDYFPPARRPELQRHAQAVERARLAP